MHLSKLLEVLSVYFIGESCSQLSLMDTLDWEELRLELLHVLLLEFLVKVCVFSKSLIHLCHVLLHRHAKLWLESLVLDLRYDWIEPVLDGLHLIRCSGLNQYD